MVDYDEELEYLLITRPHPRCLEALDRLRALGDRATAYLLALLSDPSDERRGRAALRLGELGCVSALDALVAAATTDESQDVRCTAMYALGRLGERSLPFALTLLSSPDAADRTDAALLLRDLALPESVQHLVGATGDPHWGVRGEAAIALGHFKGSVTAEEAVIAASHDPDPRVREDAVTALLEVGSPEATTRLREMLSDPAASVRTEVQDLAGVEAPYDIGETQTSSRAFGDA